MSTLLSVWKDRWLAGTFALPATLRQTLALALLAMATMAGAWIVIPLPGTPVPITLQTMIVLTGAGLLGRGLGSSAQAFYLVLGGIGLPAFAGGAFGAPVFFGPTGGYLLGFVLASAVAGSHRGTLASIGARLLIAEALILVCGTLWLSVALQVSLAKAWALGAWPFLPGDAVKLAAAAVIIRSASQSWRRALNA